MLLQSRRNKIICGRFLLIAAYVRLSNSRLAMLSPHRLALLLSSAVLWLAAPPAPAQLTPDGTLGGEGSTVTPDALVQGDLAELIEGGAIRGGNLFHSFLEFNVDAGQRVYFANPAGIESILSRVTGGDPSNIFGTLGVDGAADLFLINPNGIVFGPGASLDLQGSFTATTADSIQLGSDGLFSAVDPASDILLTLNPSIFWFNGLRQPGSIEARGLPTVPSALKVPNGEILRLIGGEITIDNGQLFASGGRIELAAMAGDNGVKIAPENNSLRALEPLGRADINIINSSLINVISSGGGAVSIYVGNISISNGSSIFGGIGFGLGNEDSRAEDIKIDATGIVSVADASFIGNATFGLGNGGDVIITAQDITLINGGQILTVGSGEGNAGDIILKASGSLSSSGRDINGTSGAILSSTVGLFPGNGNSGNITIEAPNIRLFDGAVISSGNALSSGNSGNINIITDNLFLFAGSVLRSNTSGTGDAGNIIIEASDRVLFDGMSANGQVSSGASSSVGAGATGVGGNVEITTNSLDVTNGAGLSASTFGTGDAGNVVIEARDRVVFDNGTAFSSVEAGATGVGGNVEITANSLDVINGAQLIASTSGTGDAGNVVIEARDRVVFDGTSDDGQFSSAAFSTVEAGATGAGGNVEITTDSLDVTSGAQLAASTSGTGDAGNVVIEARDRVMFDSTSADGRFSSGASSTVAAGATGAGGNVEITAHSLEVLNGAALTASTFGTGDAGNVVIEARDRTVFENSTASSTVEAGATGAGGNVEITTDSLDVTSGAQLAASTLGTGDAGNVVIEARDRVMFDSTSADGRFSSGAFSTVEAGATGAGGNVEITANSLEVLNGAQLTASTLGNGDAGNVVIEARDRVNLQGSGPNGRPSGILTSNTDLATGQSNDIQITAPELRVQEGAVVIASTRNDQPGGNIALSLGRLAVLNGGQVVTGSLGSGPAGTLQVDATGGIVIAGSDPTFAARVEQIPETALLFIPQSSLSVRSSATGAAGNIIIGELGTTPRLELNDGGQITADSAAVDGGDIVITLNDLLLLRNGSQISTTAGTAQAGGNGGNITITVPFIIAIPAENSDIASDAFEGTGGNVTITARGIFGIEPRSERTPLSDITASSELGFSGVVTLNTLDTSAIENSLTDLADVVIDTAALTAGSCIARTDESLGSFTVTGSGGLPQRPGDSAISAYPTGTVQTLTTATHTLLEPDGVYQLPDGRLVLSRACE
jgi:filamentous hemagglutinin family protein